jgi:hypothetical protein
MPAPDVITPREAALAPDEVALYDRSGCYIARVKVGAAVSIIICGSRAFSRSAGGHFAEVKAAVFGGIPAA